MIKKILINLTKFNLTNTISYTLIAMIIGGSIRIEIMDLPLK